MQLKLFEVDKESNDYFNRKFEWYVSKNFRKYFYNGFEINENTYLKLISKCN